MTTALKLVATERPATLDEALFHIDRLEALLERVTAACEGETKRADKAERARDAIDEQNRRRGDALIALTLENDRLKRDAEFARGLESVKVFDVFASVGLLIEAGRGLEGVTGQRAAVRFHRYDGKIIGIDLAVARGVSQGAQGEGEGIAPQASTPVRPLGVS